MRLQPFSLRFLSAYQTASRYPAYLVFFLYHFSGYVFWFDEFRLLAATCIAMCLTSSSSAPLQQPERRYAHRADKNPERRLPRSNAANVDVFTNFRYQRNTSSSNCAFRTSTSVILPATAAPELCLRTPGNQRLLQRSQSGVNFQNDAVVAVDFGFDHAVTATLPAFFAALIAPDLRMFSLPARCRR